MRIRVAIPAMLACAGLLLGLGLMAKRAAIGRDRRMGALTQTYIIADPGLPVFVPRLITTDGSILAPERLRGRWSVIFTGFTACPLVCPKTLAVLSAAARIPESGVSSGTTQFVFVSIDPEHDTPAGIRTYLDNFDRRIVGLTGSREAVDRFSREIGAGSAAVESGIDHSTSLFVLDPRGRLAGTLLRPGNPARLVADLTALRAHADRIASLGR